MIDLYLMDLQKVSIDITVEPNVSCLYLMLMMTLWQ